jgi:cytochrome b561
MTAVGRTSKPKPEKRILTALAIERTAPRRYTRIAIWLHWLVAALIFANMALALSVDAWPDDWVRPVIDMHKSIGITVLGLVVLRILWRLGHPPPPLPMAYRPWERVVSHAAHGLLYVLIVAMPLTGWMHDSAYKDGAAHPIRLFGLVPFPRIGAIENLEPALKEHWHSQFFVAHEACAWALLALVALHVAGALKHELFDREREIARMWPAPKTDGERR